MEVFLNLQLLNLEKHTEIVVKGDQLEIVFQKQRKTVVFTESKKG